MKWQLIILIMAGILLIGLASAQLSVGYNDKELGVNFIYTAPVNYSIVNVNNSQYLQSLTPAQVAALYSETDPLSVAITGGIMTGNLSLNSNFIVGSTLFVNSALGRVGIGTTSPSATLDVRGGGNFSADIYVRNASKVCSADGTNCPAGATAEQSPFSNDTSAIYIRANYPKNVNITGNLSIGQRVGIGTVSPAYLLETSKTTSGKDVNLSGTLYVNGTSGNVGIGTTGPGTTLNVVGNANITGGLNVSNGLNVLTGNVGIGTGNLTIGGSMYQPVYASDDGLVLNLPFSEGVGTTTYDKSPYGNDGTLRNGTVTCANSDCPTWTNGKYGNAISFDGINDSVSTNDINALDFQPNFTVSVWVKANNLIKAQQDIVVKHNSGDSYVFGIIQLTNRFIWRIATGSDVYDSSAISSGQWYHLVGVLSNNQTASFYRNGILQATTSRTAIGSTKSVTIGCDGASGCYYDRSFNGTLDEVKIYNRALSQDEIRTQYLQGMQSHGYAMADKFRIINTSASKMFELNQSGMHVSIGGTERLTVLGSNVGIGTTSPTYPLTVVGNVSGISIWADGNVSADDYMYHSNIWDSKYDVWDYIKPSSTWSVNGKINHKLMSPNVYYNNISRQVGVRNETHKECEMIEEKEVCKDVVEIIPVYQTFQVEGVSVSEMDAKFNDALYELKQENEMLKITDNFILNQTVGLTGNYSIANACWMYYIQGILKQTNCTAL